MTKTEEEEWLTWGVVMVWCSLSVRGWHCRTPEGQQTVSKRGTNPLHGFRSQTQTKRQWHRKTQQKPACSAHILKAVCSTLKCAPITRFILHSFWQWAGVSRHQMTWFLSRPFAARPLCTFEAHGYQSTRGGSLKCLRCTSSCTEQCMHNRSFTTVHEKLMRCTEGWKYQ